MKAKLILLVVLINCGAALFVWGGMHAFIYIDEKIQNEKTQLIYASRDIEAQGRKGEAGHSSDLRIDDAMLKDKSKFNSTLDTFKKKYRNITTAESLEYIKIPESAFFRSVFEYFFLSRVLGGKEVVLDKEAIKDFMDKGILVNSIDKKYPFMKKSIYLDKRYGSSNKPVLQPGTNIVIVFVESLSSFFLRDDVHGIKGLTPNIKDMAKYSYSLSNMKNSAFPTIKGLIAALGSSIYLLDENIGGTRIPIPCRFLFLSEILKSLNYTSIHIQGGSERFIGMRDFFIKREGYDQFYGSESLVLENLGNISQGFGVDDSSVFSYAKEWLDKYPGEKPFLLTISTINMHPPFKVSVRNPNSGNNDLLDSLYSTDKAFGTFWEYFKKSKYRDNTMVILTADHAMGNNKDYLSFIKDYPEYARPFFDRIPFFIYFPHGAWAGRTNNIDCVQLDILPTMLDMMNKDLPNPFMGLSVFADRRFYTSKKFEERINPLNVDFSEEQVKKAKKVLGFYLNLYRENRIIPADYKVRFN